MNSVISYLFIVTAHLLLFTVHSGQAEPTKWALLVAGSNGWGNYRHQVKLNQI